MRPLIGIPCHAGVGKESDRPIFFNNIAYIRAVENAGGVPVLIPILEKYDGLDTLLPRLDGLLLSGGIDVDPMNYREEPHPMLGKTNPELDELELALTKWAMEQNVPMLGICRGMQLLNVATGGSLYQDIAAQYPGSLKHPNWEKPRNMIAHTIHIEPGTRMEQLLGTSEVQVNSLHHQAAKEAGQGVIISGHANDGVAELLEIPDHRFMLAVQGHPEELYNNEENAEPWRRLFRAFIEESSKPATRTMITVSDVLTVGVR
jgi:putative glutamine amidotransferase